MEITASMVKELRERTGAGMMDCKKALAACDGDMTKSVDWLREKGISKAEKKASRVTAEGLCEIAVCPKCNKAVIYEINCETDFVAKNDKFKALQAEFGELLLKSDVKNAEEALAYVAEDGKTLKDKLMGFTAIMGENVNLRNVHPFVKTPDQSFGVYKHNGGKIVGLVILNGGNEQIAKSIAMHVVASNPQYLNQSQIGAEYLAHEKDILLKEALNNNPGKPVEIIEKMVMGRLNKSLKDICLVNQPFVMDPNQTVEQYLKSCNASVANFMRVVVGEGIEKEEVDFATEVMSQMKK